MKSKVFALLAIACAASDQHQRALPRVLEPSAAPLIRRMLFVIVTDPQMHDAAFARADYELALRRAAIALERETLNRVQMHYAIKELPIGNLGDGELRYDARTFMQWYEDLRDVFDGETYDILAFAPNQAVPWCTDAHSLGVVVAGTTFTCLEAPKPIELASNLLIHKIFHTFGFFHQDLRNKQYRLLDWELGLPSFTDLPISFFSPMARAAIERGLGCSKPADRPEECRDVSGPFDRDVDHDGIRDDHDGYPVSPPMSGPDADHDGIPDALDRCPDSEVVVTGDVDGGPMNYWSKRSPVQLSVTVRGKPIEVRWVAASVDTKKPLGDLMYFDPALEHVGGSITLDKANPTRVRAIYDYRGRAVVRTFYVYGDSSLTSPGPWAYFNEKEWYYFGRFGCDPPAGLDLYDSTSYDADANGLPDALDLIDYDWDGDGVPDLVDTLPTVAGQCADARVRGVKDTDGDGFCDLGALSFDALGPIVPRRSYFGEIPTGMGNDPDADLCPYLPGPDHGCPLRRDGKPWYADAYPFE